MFFFKQTWVKGTNPVDVLVSDLVVCIVRNTIKLAFETLGENKKIAHIVVE